MSSGYSNRIIAITTSGRSIDEYLDRVTAGGGRLIALPTIDIVPAGPEVVKKFVQVITSRKHEFCVFLSSNAVDALFNLARKTSNFGELVSLLNSRTIIAIGPKTKKRLEDYRVKVHVMPEEYSTRGLIEMLKSDITLVKRKSIIIPRSSESDSSLKKSLLNLGMETVDEIFLYSVKTSEAGNNVWKEFVSLLNARMLDCIVFTSASSVKAFFKILQNNHSLSNIQDKLNGIKMIIALGPLTWQELERLGVQSTISDIHTINGAFEVAKRNLSI
ncbi:MAG TPA: uroporphyrinogen-III synthase [Nitrososphaeraceae archaeon]|nr:uroporphyrinogen-III synthase [Nitrososphaeraceae archaeon]